MRITTVGRLVFFTGVAVLAGLDLLGRKETPVYPEPLTEEKPLVALRLRSARYWVCISPKLACMIPGTVWRSLKLLFRG